MVTSPGRSYLVCSAPRSGTTLLCRALADAGLGVPDEYFLAGDEEQLPGWRFWELGPFGDPGGAMSREDYLAAIHERGSSANGVFGAKLMWHNVPWAVRKFQEMPRFAGLDRSAVLHAALPGLRVVHVQRRDTVRQAVSWARMVQDGVWVVSDDEPAEPLADPTYDFGLIHELHRIVAASGSGWSELFEELGVEPLRVTYEDDLTGPARLGETIRAVGRLIDVEPHVDPAAVVPRTRRQADELSEEWVRRYLEEVGRWRT